MLNIKNKQIFIDTIKNKNLNLSDNLIDAVSLILCLVNSELQAKNLIEKANFYSANIADYVKNTKNKQLSSYELVLAALNNNVNIEQKEFIKSLVSINQSNKVVIPAKIAHKKLISV